MGLATEACAETGDMDARAATAAVTATPSVEAQRVFIFLGELGVGGAERQAIALAVELRRQGHDVRLIALADGRLRQAVDDAALPLTLLPRLRRFAPASVPALRRLLDDARPDVIYAFLDVQWLLALAARGRATRPLVVLGLRTSRYADLVHGFRNRVVHWLTRHTARFADVLIANSHAGLRDFTRHAVAAPDGHVVPNGIDETRFVRDAAARARWRGEWNIPEGARVVGHVGRFDPVKHHERLLDAFALLRHTHPDAVLVCVGDGSPGRSASLKSRAEQLGIAPFVRFPGATAEVAGTYNAFDALVLCSHREGFPNVVAEGMACGIPAVVTDVGACAAIVGDLGEVVRRDGAAALADSIARLFARMSTTLSDRCRERILAEYTLTQVARRTAEIFSDALRRLPR